MKRILLLFVFMFLLSACAGQLPAQPELPAGELPANPPAAPEVIPPAIATLPPTETNVPTAEPTAAPLPQWVAFIGNDGNVRLVDRISGELRDVTSDAIIPAADAPDQTFIQYRDLTASSDGQFLAFRRDITRQVDMDYSYVYEVWLYLPASAESRLLMPNQATGGMDWKPGTHLLTYAVPPDPSYFATHQIDTSQSRGIWAIDVDNGENMELVQPERGFSIALPRWSPDGRYLSFEEIWNIEGSGYLAYYDFQTQEYKSFEQPIGAIDWSPDGQRLAFDGMTYMPSGNEQIFLRPLTGGEDIQVAPDYAVGYTYAPRFSPSGGQIAYLYHDDNIDNRVATLQVQLFDGGEVRNLGDFETPLYLSWLPDESGVIIAVGPFGTRQIMEVSLDGTVRILADGDAPVVVSPVP